MIANRGFRAACLTILFLSAVFFTAILYVPQLMEKILGYSALEAGRRDAADAGHLRRRRLPLRPVYAGSGCAGDPRRHRAARGRAAAALVLRRRLRLRRAACPGCWRPASAPASSTRRSPRRRSACSTSRSRASPAGSPTCSRSPAARSGSGLHDPVHDPLRGRGRAATPRRSGCSSPSKQVDGHPRRPRRDRVGQGGVRRLRDLGRRPGPRGGRDSFVAGVQFSFRVVAAIALVGLVIAVLGVRPDSAGRNHRNPLDPAATRSTPTPARRARSRARRRRPTRA